MTRRRERRGTAAQWTASNEVLLSGEFGIELSETTEAHRFKIGDGVTAWNDLDYAGGGDLPTNLVTLDGTGAIGAGGTVYSVLLVDSGDDTVKRLAVSGGEVTLDGQPVGDLPDGVVIREEDGSVLIESGFLDLDTYLSGGGLVISTNSNDPAPPGEVGPRTFRLTTSGYDLDIFQITDGNEVRIARIGDPNNGSYFYGPVSAPAFSLDGLFILGGQVPADNPLAAQAQPGTPFFTAIGYPVSFGQGIQPIFYMKIETGNLQAGWVPILMSDGSHHQDTIRDTGWRRINLLASYPNLDPNARYLIRRIGNQVHHDVNIQEPDGAGYGAWYSNILPLGFRDDVEGAFFAGRHQNNNTSARTISLWSTYGADAGIDGGPVGRFIGSGVTTTSDPWPNVLPGTPFPT